MTTFKVPENGPAGTGRHSVDPRRTHVARSSSSRTRIISGLPSGGDADDATEDPVTAWLVIVTGPGRGQFVTMGSGVHTLGRGADNKLILDFGDDTISEADHIRLIYEPKTSAFYAVLGTGKNLIDVDGETLLDRIKLNAGSQLDFGVTVLRFVPFCGADFSWAQSQAE